VGIAALHSPTTAITDFVSVARAYADDVVAAGGRVELSFPVDAIRQLPDRVEVRSGERSLTFDRLVV
jgi:L-2-hydroxyglutarate oxidase LhgO